MNASVKTKSKATTPVLLCRLCHCEFTNFKEHVKSLVHLDARETKTTAKPPIKSKGCGDVNTIISKKVKSEIFSELSNSNECIRGGIGSDSMHLTSLVNTTEGSTNYQLQVSTCMAEDKSVADLNGTANLKDDTEMQDPEHGAVASKVGSQRVNELTEFVFLERHWHCKLCDCVQFAEDGSFDEHACDKSHQEALASKFSSLKKTVKGGDHTVWLINCSACAFETNDKAQFVSHLLTELHDCNLKNVIQNARTVVFDRTKNHSMKCESEVHKTNTKVASSASKNTNSKSATHQADASTSTSGNYYQGRKSQRSNGAPQSPKFHPSSIPKPLMSLNLPVECWNKKKPGWKSNPTVSLDHSSSKPGILGEYRPDFHSQKIGFDGYSQDNWFSRSADLQSSDHHDPLLHSKIGSSSSSGRPTYSEVSQHSHPATSARTFQVDSFTSFLGSNKYDSVPRRQSSLTSPTEKLNSWAFEQVEQESPTRHLDILSNFLTLQRTGTLPSSVSLDLASNSSIRLKHSSKQGTLFDNCSISFSDASTSNLSRMNFTSDEFSKSMYSRR